MALPSSGPLSIGDIRNEQVNNGGFASSYSLRQLSSNAGKSTPDAISEFYGYSAGFLYKYDGLTLVSSTTPFCEAVMKNRVLTIRRFTIYIVDNSCNPITSHPNYTFTVSITSNNSGGRNENITINNGSSSNYTTYVAIDACDTNNQETVTITNSDGLTQCSL